MRSLVLEIQEAFLFWVLRSNAEQISERVGCYRAPAKTSLRVRGVIWAGLAFFVSGLMAVRGRGEARSCRGRTM